MAKKKWRFDVAKMTLNDMILLEEAGEGKIKARGLRDLLARFVVDKTPEEIGTLTLPELGSLADALGEAVKEGLELPKASTTG